LSAPSSGLSTDAFPVGFNFLAHGSQDLYPTYVQENKGLSAHASVVATIIGNCVRDPYCFILLLPFFLFHLLQEYSLLSCVLSQPFLSFLFLCLAPVLLLRLPPPFSLRGLTSWLFMGRDAVPHPIPVSVHSPQHSHTYSLPRAWHFFARCVPAGWSGVSLKPALGSVARWVAECGRRVKPE
jgi:hypothetical protein